MHADILPTRPSPVSAFSWRGAALIAGPWILLGFLFLAEQHAAGQPAFTPSAVFRRMVGPCLGAALTPLGLKLARRLRVEPPHRLRRVAAHLLLAFGTSAAAFTALYGVHRLAGTLGAEPLSAWLASTLHEGMLYYAVVILVGHLLARPGTQPAGMDGKASEEAAAAPPVAGHLTLKLRERTLLVAPAEVAWIEADGHHVGVHLVSGETHTVRDSLARLEASLRPFRFVRVHRSTLVNVAQVKELRPWFAGDSLLFLKDGTELRMSRRYAGGLRGLVGG